jgi:hypothetical protein
MLYLQRYRAPQSEAATVPPTDAKAVQSAKGPGQQ